MKLANIRKRMKRALDDNSGVAMIVSMIVGVVVMVFCLTLIMVVYTLFSQTSRQNTRMQCKLLAQSFSEELADVLLDDTSELNKYLSELVEEEMWITAEDMADDTITKKPGVVSELIFEITDVAGPGYIIEVAFSLEEDEELEEEDDIMDGTPEGGPESNPEDPLEENPDEPDEGEPVVDIYNINAKITCRRGQKNAKDVQAYTQDSEYTNVPLGVQDEDDE